MLAVFQAEGAELEQRCCHAHSCSVGQPIAAVHIEMQQAAGCRTLTQRLDARICDALAAFQAQHLETRRSAQMYLKGCRDQVRGPVAFLYTL